VPYNRGLAVHVVASNVGTNATLPAGQPIELAFDRLLLPITVNRQSFVLVDAADPSTAITFTIAYDPVARVVTMNPVQALTPNHTYTLTILSPSIPTDASGLHAIDGATMDPNSPKSFSIQVGNAAATAPQMCNGVVGPCIDFCNDVYMFLPTTCGALQQCHSAKPVPVLGLTLGPKAAAAAQYIAATAIGRLAVESTMGALSEPGAPSSHFGQDMPIIDATSTVDGPPGTGDPGNSFLMYKVLMAGPANAPSASMTVYPSLTWPGPGGQAGVVPALEGSERDTLASYIAGREMPLSTVQGAIKTTPNPGLSVDQLETLSLWIAQGAPLANCQ
jgi:hypothetical protein